MECGFKEGCLRSKWRLLILKLDINSYAILRKLVEVLKYFRFGNKEERDIR